MSEDPAQRFEEIFEREYGLVLAFVSRRTLDDQQAQDVAAETFLTAWRRVDQIPDESLPWLYGVARRVLANSFRSSRRWEALAARLASESAPTSMTSRDPAEAAEERQLFAHALVRVRPSDRDVLLLASWDGLSNEQAARVLEVSERSFAVRLHRARRRLEAALQDAESAEGRRPSERGENP